MQVKKRIKPLRKPLSKAEKSLFLDNLKKSAKYRKRARNILDHGSHFSVVGNKILVKTLENALKSGQNKPLVLINNNLKEGPLTIYRAYKEQPRKGVQNETENVIYLIHFAEKPYSEKKQIVEQQKTLYRDAIEPDKTVKKYRKLKDGRWIDVTEETESKDDSMVGWGTGVPTR